MEEPGAEAAGPLNAERAERILRLQEKMERRLEAEELTKLYRELELPLIGTLASMELAGIAIDRQAFADMSREIEIDLEKLTKEVYELAGQEFNINSPKQLAEVLFVKHNLPSFKKTQKQRAPSTSVRTRRPDASWTVRVTGASRRSVKLTVVAVRNGFGEPPISSRLPVAPPAATSGAAVGAVGRSIS